MAAAHPVGLDTAEPPAIPEAMLGICQVTAMRVIDRSANPNASENKFDESPAAIICETKLPAILILKVVTAAMKTVSRR